MDAGRDPHPFGCAPQSVSDLRMTDRSGVLGTYPTNGRNFGALGKSPTNLPPTGVHMMMLRAKEQIFEEL